VNESQFNRGSWLALGAASLLILTVLGVNAYRFTLPTDGWVYDGFGGGFSTDLLGPPSGIRPGDQPQGTAAYGEYLTRAVGCRDCHGPNLVGTSGDQGPAAPNLTVIVPHWSEKNLMKLFRNGVDPSGNPVSDEMPWKSYGKMFTDEQLKDLYTYLSSLQPITATRP
jgi:mono/diheme cytochrome c family protein